MAVSKLTENMSFSIEVEKGVDKLGNPTFRKKTFRNVNKDADIANVYDVANSISDILEPNSKGYLLNTVDNLIEG